ncbi:hypothetical protein HYFRA_00011314 [Hymenoscyphus fraxineus]|uniref:Uncharacterized protein n=1 Tax=Hymenoscyphus fraxineus TaxID=746836 RepID=A0A9N9KWT4_9HELO|nr:hypothetical protein HYFRA_00011314 [Hymenoscyphus fraxineus]
MGDGNLKSGCPVPPLNISAISDKVSPATMLPSHSPTPISEPAEVESNNEVLSAKAPSSNTHSGSTCSGGGRVSSPNHKMSKSTYDMNLESEHDGSLSIGVMTPTSSSLNLPAFDDAQRQDDNPRHGSEACASHLCVTSCQFASSSIPSTELEICDTSYTTANTLTPRTASDLRPPPFQLLQWLQATDREEITTIERIQRCDWLTCPLTSDHLFTLI